jgi:hypothetical protein
MKAAGSLSITTCESTFIQQCVRILALKPIRRRGLETEYCCYCKINGRIERSDYGYGAVERGGGPVTGQKRGRGLGFIRILYSTVWLHTAMINFLLYVSASRCTV